MPDEATLEQLLPQLKNLIDDRAELRLHIAFRRIYEYLDKNVADLKKTIEAQTSTQSAAIAQQTNLVNGFATQLIGLKNQANPLAELGTGNISSFTVATGGNLTGGGTINSNGATVTLALTVNPSVTTITISGAKISSGNGDPNGTVIGSTGDLFLRRDGGANTTLYVKEAGAATNLNWVPK